MNRNLNPIQDRVMPTRWEPCVTFSPEALGEAVCAECGWLEDEHDELPPARRLAS